MVTTAERLSSLIQKELVLINDVIQDKQIGYINLTDVKVTKDLSFANVYYTILSDDPTVLKLTEETIEQNKVVIRLELAKKIKNFRKIPDLVFKYDKSLSYGRRIENILKDINK
ncbi:30S ribosome-binding factor RbfA ['Elaeagnus angustifolia' witches'-broom phytoplasma]|uniref:Ribosome-binding factor A n=1 Tax='Elaeagnus angustifolia' witches'-broom phytoplasma TaxID=1538355 RepID=A0ABS5V8G0_9MOLU|nr:30S ribosome-binding factor RbfA ['Elaeagnus angustifolia' witches'-broom phytoplasma]MBY7576785.1 30S ribosome-binding factor RbfA [Candidatus Phytoplasma australiense]MCX2955536.1 30S ribosome-binding factor RbfA [Candidatus Phytoplasma australiense]